MGMLVLTNPADAASRIRDAYREAGCSQRGAAGLMGCNEQTLCRWIVRLQLGPELRAVRQQARDEGWAASRGGRPQGSKDSYQRKRRASEKKRAKRG
jgi:hypothetical protein